MPIYTNINGVQVPLGGLTSNINGSLNYLDTALINMNGINKSIYIEPIPLISIGSGNTVCFNTCFSGSDALTDFIILGQSQSSNSILLLQRYIYDNMKIAFNQTDESEYNGSYIDSLTQSIPYVFNFPEPIQNRLVNTDIISYSYNLSKYITLSRSIFLMSAAEINIDSCYVSQSVKKIISQESLTSYTDSLNKANDISDNAKEYYAAQVRTESGDYGTWWLRSPADSTWVSVISNNGMGQVYMPTYEAYLRFVISLSPDTLVDPSYTTPILIG